jgi:hypothetical protein
LTEAARWGHEAIRHSPRDYLLWAAAANFDTRRGNIALARRELVEVRRLNPHSILLVKPKPGGG